MNIFEILAAGNRVLKEEHISAVLGWIIDPYHDHGLGVELLKRVVSQYYPGTPLANLIVSREFTGLEMRERAKLNVRTILEVPVVYEEKSRSIDILITIGDEYVLAIENKTSKGSIDKTQLKEEVLGLTAHDSFNGKKIYFLFLTPENPGSNAEEALGQIPAGVCIAEHATWQGTKSISQILQNLLMEESSGKTSPLSTEVGFLVKSFIRFIENGFSFYQGESINESGQVYSKTASGLIGLEEMGENSGYVGYTGGPKVFANDIDQARSDERMRSYLLSERTFRWSADNTSGHKNKTNWIPIREMFDIAAKRDIISK